MTVYIGWSGETGRQLAEILKRWLGAILPEIRILTNVDLKVGNDWHTDLQTTILNADCGVFCITRKSLYTSWLSFEAGLLSSKRPSVPIISFLFGVKPTETGPFCHFQCIYPVRDDLCDLVTTLFRIAKEQGMEAPDVEVLKKRMDLILPAFQSDLDELWTEEQKLWIEEQKKIQTPMTEINHKLDAILSVLPAAQRNTGPAPGLSQSAYSRPRPESL